MILRSCSVGVVGIGVVQMARLWSSGGSERKHKGGLRGLGLGLGFGCEMVGVDGRSTRLAINLLTVQKKMIRGT